MARKPVAHAKVRPPLWLGPQQLVGMEGRGRWERTGFSEVGV